MRCARRSLPLGEEAFLIADLPDDWLDLAKMRNAARNGENTTIEHLVNGGIDPNVANVIGVTPLRVAAYIGHEPVVQTLISAGANPNRFLSCDYDGSNRGTPLHVCVVYGHYKITKLLVEARASIEFRDEHDRTPAMVAKKLRHMRIWRYLQTCEKNREQRK